MKIFDKLFGIKQNRIQVSAPKQQINIVTSSEAHKYYQDGQRFFHQGNYAQAIEVLHKGISIEPIFAAYANLGKSLKEIGRFAEATNAFEQAIEIDATDLGIHVELSNCYISDNRWDDALAFLTTALKRHQSVDLYYNLGCVYSAKQMYDQAIEAQRQALRFDPTDEDALFNVGTDLFNKYLGENDPKLLAEAITNLKRCVSIDPAQTDAQAFLDRLRHIQATSLKTKVDILSVISSGEQSTDEFKIGDTIILRNGFYRCQVETIKRGGMGIVYIARHHKTHNLRAIKTFQGQTASALNRFAREAEIWIRLDGHFNIVAAEYVELVDDRLYILMDYIDGFDLRERMSQKKLTLSQILDFAIQFCSGMDFAYKKAGIIHRDIKPENILVTHNDIIKITDFGLAKTITENAKGEVETSNKTSQVNIALTHTGNAAGTIPYMPPEQFENFKNVGITADVYAFGITLYEMLVDHLPFSNRSMMELSHLNQLPPLLQQFDPRIPSELEELVLSCLHKSPSERPADFEVLGTELLSLFYSITGKRYIVLPDRGGEYRHKRVMGYSNLMNTGESLQNMKDYKKAMTYFQEAANLNAIKISPFIALIKCCRELGQINQAIIYCEQALEIEPKNSTLWNTKGSLYLEIFDQDKGLESLNRALAINPQEYEALVNKSICLSRLGHYKEALSCCDQVPEYDKNAAAALNNKGTILWAVGKYGEAMSCLERALIIDPDNTEAKLNKRNYELELAELNKDRTQNYKEWINHGLVLFKDEQFQKAIECFEEALIFDDKQAEVWTYKADALSEIGESQKAASNYEKALECNDSFFDAWFGLGNCRFDQEQFENALRCFERASQLQPNDEQVWIGQGSALANLSRFMEALKCFDKALAITPEDEIVQTYRVACEEYL